MLKNILNLNGAQELSKNEQLSINGGGRGPICGGNCQKCDSISQIGPCCQQFPQTCP